MLLQKWLPFTDGWNNLCAKSGNYFQSGRYFKLLWNEKCRIRGIGSVWDYEVSIMSLLASDILCFMGYWECHLLSSYCLFFSKKMSHYFATKPERGWMEQIWSWNQKAIFHQLSGTGMGCSLCDFLWTLISSDKSNRLNCSNEQTVPTSPQTPRCSWGSGSAMSDANIWFPKC